MAGSDTAMSGGRGLHNSVRRNSDAARGDPAAGGEDAMSLGAAIASVNAALGIAKGLRAIEKAYDQAVLKSQVIDLMSTLNDARSALLDAQEALNAKEQEIYRLTKALNEGGELIVGPGGYQWRDQGQGKKLGYPLCPACLLKGHQVQMLQKGGHHTAACPSCSHAAAPVECFLEPAQDGSQETVREQRDRLAQAQFDRDTALIRGRHPFRA
jgi:multidrug efflux pump subunit AcrA (membrane-fusion protein)